MGEQQGINFTKAQVDHVHACMHTHSIWKIGSARACTIYQCMPVYHNARG